jgi:PilZ domain
VTSDTPLQDRTLAEATPSPRQDRHVQTEPAPGTNRRAYRRLRADEVANLGAKLANGGEIRLVDLSQSGAQFECDRRFLPNATVTLRLVTSQSTFVVDSRVVRSRLVRLTSGGLGYNVAVAFDKALPAFAEEPSRPAVAASSTTEVPSGPADRAPIAPADAPVAFPMIDTGSIDTGSDVGAAELGTFEATTEAAQTTCVVTAAVAQSDEDIHALFNGNDW